MPDNEPESRALSTLQDLIGLAASLFAVWYLAKMAGFDTERVWSRVKAAARGTDLGRRIRLARETRRQTGHVLWEAVNIVEGAE